MNIDIAARSRPLERCAPAEPERVAARALRRAYERRVPRVEARPLSTAALAEGTLARRHVLRASVAVSGCGLVYAVYRWLAAAALTCVGLPSAFGVVGRAIVR
jgi:hypothetical protein